jgi:anthranilate phosphoribosyltransferase
MNAAAALMAGNKVDSLEQGVILAQEVIDHGQALIKLEQLIDFTQKI